MESLAQIAAALQQVLTTVADEAAREVGFIRRRRVWTGAGFVQTLVFGWLGRPEASVHQLTQLASTVGIGISPQGLDQRFGPAAAALLERVLAAATAIVVASSGVTTPLLQRFAGVWILDCTTIGLPDALATTWPGCGGRTAQGTAAALKLQVRLDLRHGQLQGPALLAGRAQDKTGPLQTAALPAGALLVQDLGFWSCARFRAVGEAGAFWLSRLHPSTAVLTPAGQRLELPRWLAGRGGATVETAVQLGVAARLPARLLARRVPPSGAAGRRRQLRVAAKREGPQPPRRPLALADWTVSVTNVPPERLTGDEAWVLGRARWQIEVLFKLWKRDGQLATSRSRQPWRVLCEVSAKLVALVLQHWILLSGCWHQANRSLVQAAQTLRDHARELVRALPDPPRLLDELHGLVRCLDTGCRVTARRTHPSAFQLLHDPRLGTVR